MILERPNPSLLRKSTRGDFAATTLDIGEKLSRERWEHISMALFAYLGLFNP